MSLETRRVDPEDEGTAQDVVQFMARFSSGSVKAEEESLRSTFSRYYALYRCGELAAAGSFLVSVREKAVLTDVVVEPGQRRQGLGSTVLAAMEEAAASEARTMVLSLEGHKPEEEAGLRDFFGSNGYKQSTSAHGGIAGFDMQLILEKPLAGPVAEQTV